MPVLLLLLVKAGLMTADGLASKRKYAILLAFIAAAILTPPDVISQVLLAVGRQGSAATLKEFKIYQE